MVQDEAGGRDFGCQWLAGDREMSERVQSFSWNEYVLKITV